MACWASGRSKRSARALIICDFKEMDRLPMASGFSAIQNNSDVSQGLSPRLAPQSTTRAVGILMPLWSRSEQIKVQAIPGLIGHTEMCHEYVGHGIRGATGHRRAQPISLA